MMGKPVGLQEVGSARLCLSLSINTQDYAYALSRVHTHAGCRTPPGRAAGAGTTAHGPQPRQHAIPADCAGHWAQ